MVPRKEQVAPKDVGEESHMERELKYPKERVHGLPAGLKYQSRKLNDLAKEDQSIGQDEDRLLRQCKGKNNVPVQVVEVKMPQQVKGTD